MYLSNSRLATWFASLTIKLMFHYNKLVQRSALHGLGDAQKVWTFYYDLLNTGRELGLAMPVMSAFEPDIQQFVRATS